MFQTKATVDHKGRLKILDQTDRLKAGEIVDVIILSPAYQSRRKQWKSILNSLGTYSDEDLKDIKQVKQEMAGWRPKGY